MYNIELFMSYKNQNGFALIVDKNINRESLENKK